MLLDSLGLAQRVLITTMCKYVITFWSGEVLHTATVESYDGVYYFKKHLIDEGFEVIPGCWIMPAAIVKIEVS